MKSHYHTYIQYIHLHVGQTKRVNQPTRQATRERKREATSVTQMSKSFTFRALPPKSDNSM